MRTASKLVYSKENYYTENGEEYKIKTTVSLGDDCHNNICEWSITADIRWKNEYGIYKEYMCGCCHDEIIRHCPELAKFIPMHVCNHYGAPMYPVENGIYHTKNSDKSVVIEYLRISDKEYSKLSEAVDDKMYFKYLLFNLGIVDRWKRESDELIAELENLCGKKWVNPYKPEKERFTLTLTDEERSLIEERIEAGYYSTENIEKRREEAHKAKMAEKRAKICEQYDKEIRKAEVGKKVIDFEKCEGNYLDVYPLIGAVLQKELRSVLGENVNKSISRNMKIKATKYRNDYRVWLDYAGDYRNENIE